MTDDDIRATVLRLLAEIAPEADPAEIDPDVNFRDQLDVDSMDLLNFLIAMHREFAVEIPERDYGKLTTVNECVTYLGERVRG
jgi:acyl carrier protein